jgi:hypothetical protein
MTSHLAPPKSTSLKQLFDVEHAEFLVTYQSEPVLLSYLFMPLDIKHTTSLIFGNAAHTVIKFLPDKLRGGIVAAKNAFHEFHDEFKDGIPHCELYVYLQEIWPAKEGNLDEKKLREVLESLAGRIPEVTQLDKINNSKSLTRDHQFCSGAVG